MMCIEIVSDKKTKSLFADDVNVAKRVWNHCQSRGLLVRPLGHLNVLSPPLLLSEAQIDFIADTLRVSIEATIDDLIKDRIWQG